MRSFCERARIRSFVSRSCSRSSRMEACPPAVPPSPGIANSSEAAATAASDTRRMRLEPAAGTPRSLIWRPNATPAPGGWPPRKDVGRRRSALAQRTSRLGRDEGPLAPAALAADGSRGRRRPRRGVRGADADGVLALRRSLRGPPGPGRPPRPRHRAARSPDLHRAGEPLVRSLLRGVSGRRRVPVRERRAGGLRPGPDPRRGVVRLSRRHAVLQRRPAQPPGGGRQHQRRGDGRLRRRRSRRASGGAATASRPSARRSSGQSSSPT